MRERMKEWSGSRGPQLYLKYLIWTQNIFKTHKEKEKARNQGRESLTSQSTTSPYISCTVLEPQPAPGAQQPQHQTQGSDSVGSEWQACQGRSQKTSPQAAPGWLHRQPWQMRLQDSREESQLVMPPKWYRNSTQGGRSYHSALHNLRVIYRPFCEEEEEQVYLLFREQ